MQIEVAGQLIANPDATHAVSLRIQRRREDTDPELAGQHSDYSAGDTTFRRHSDAVNPFAGVIIHAARAHDAQHAFHVFTADRLPASHRVDTAVGERGGHDAQLPACHRDGALLKIQIDDRDGVFAEDVEVAQHV